MAFRKTVDEYATQPVGAVSSYKQGTYIDSENNVYYHDGVQYIKIGYDTPILDDYIKYFPKVGLGLLFMNIFLPKGRDFWTRLAGIVFALFVLLWYDIIAWVNYQLVTLFAKPLLQATEKYKWLRLFLPFTWFVDQVNKDQVTIAGGATMMIPYILLSIPVQALASYDAPELAPLGAILILCALLSAFYMFLNVRINKRNFVDKF